MILNELKDHIHKNVITVTGKNHHDNIAGNTTCYNEDVIATYEKPIKPEAGCVVVKGNLALNGAVMKPSAATPALMKHKGRAVVFESIEDYHARIDDPELDIDETCVMVLKYAGPVGYPGMPEVGNMALPKKILEKGIKDMVRISDGRMSGTAYGTAVLHVSPESAIGGNLALVLNGDMPLVTKDIIEKLYLKHTTSNAAMSFVTAHNCDPSAAHYGRVIQSQDAISIVEAKEFKGDITESCCINAGIYILKRTFLEENITKLQNLYPFPNLSFGIFPEVYTF